MKLINSIDQLAGNSMVNDELSNDSTCDYGYWSFKHTHSTGINIRLKVIESNKYFVLNFPLVRITFQSAYLQSIDGYYVMMEAE